MTIFELSQEYKRQRESQPPCFAHFHNFAEWCDEQRRLACVVQGNEIIQQVGNMADLSGNNRHLTAPE
jgi:hypothetical protein